MTSPSCPNEACIQRIGSPVKVVRHGFFRVRCGRRRYRLAHGRPMAGQSSGAGSTVQRTPHLWDPSRRASSRRAENVCALQSKAHLGFHKHGSVLTAMVFNSRRAAQSDPCAL